MTKHGRSQSRQIPWQGCGGSQKGETSFSVGPVFSGHSLTLKALVSGSISQREKSVSRSPLLSIFRYPVTPRGMEKDCCVLSEWKEVQGPLPYLVSIP